MCGLASSATAEWKLGPSQINCLYVLARFRFKHCSIIKYDINDEKNPKVYGILGYFFGHICDVDFNSEFMRCMGKYRGEIYAYTHPCFNKRSCNIWLSETTIPDEMPIDSEINTETMDWKLFSGPTYNFTVQQSPVLSSGGSLTNKMSFGEEFGYAWVAPVSSGYMNFFKQMISWETFNIDECKNTDMLKVKSFRLEFIEKNGFNKKNTPVNIDGEKYWGTKVQGTILYDKQVFVIC